MTATALPPLPTPGVPAGALPVPPDAGVDALRQEVDALDREVVALLQQRLERSRRIQQLRVAAGGARVQHAREADVLRTWTEGLGPAGATIALEVLALCRGPLTPRAAAGRVPG